MTLPLITHHKHDASRQRFSRGFTLVEMLIYMGLLVSFVAVLSAMLVSILENQLSSNASSTIEQEAQYIASRLEYDLTRSTSVSTPAGAGDTATSLVTTIGGSPYTFAVNSNKLTSTDSSGTTQLHGEDTVVSNFTVTRVGNPSGIHSFIIQFTLSSLIEETGVTESKDVRLTTGLRK